MSLRHKEVQFVAGARHCDVKKPTLLLDFGCCAGGKIGGDTPVDHIQHEHGAPFLSLGGMNGGKDQIVFIEQRRPASLLVASGGSSVSAVRNCWRDR